MSRSKTNDPNVVFQMERVNPKVGNQEKILQNLSKAIIRAQSSTSEADQQNFLQVPGAGT